MNKSNLSWKINGFILIGAIVTIGGLLLGNKPIAELSEFYKSLVLAIGIPFPVISCILIIIYREVPRPGRKPITGWWAVFQGFLVGVPLIITETFMIIHLFKSVP